MREKDAKSPATTMDQYDVMLPAWTKIQTVLDGTEALRDAGQDYLPQHDKESDIAYSERLKRCTLLNLTKLTLNSWTGRPFSEPIVLKEDVPAEIVDLSENIDTLGSHINVFSRNWFRDGVALSFSHVLVDMPRLTQPEDRERSRADDLREGVRPYWVNIRPEQLFFAESQIVNGKEVLVEIRFEESITVRDGFAIVTENQIRRLYLNVHGVVTVEIYKHKKMKNNKVEWVLDDEYDMEIDEIPLVTFYSDRDSFMLGKSPIEDLSDINIAHWQSTSDQRAILTVARFPVLACSGGTDETNKLVLSPFKWLYCPDPQGRFYYVEHSGAAITAGRLDLEDLVHQMGEYGAEFLKKRPGRETATARILDSTEATSALQDIVLRFQDSVETALALTAKWLNLDSGGSIKIKSDFAEAPGGGETLRTLLEARKNKDISQPAFVKEMKRHKVLEEDFDADADAILLEEEAVSFNMINTDADE